MGNFLNTPSPINPHPRNVDETLIHYNQKKTQENQMTTLESVAPPSTPSFKWLFRGLLIGLLAGILFLVVSRVLSSRPGTLTLKTSGLQFSETEIHVKVGQTVNLELFNVDGYAHSFDMDTFNIHIPLPGSQTATVTFTPTEPGIYQFYCGAYGHQAAGMVGTLIVEP